MTAAAPQDLCCLCPYAGCSTLSLFNTLCIDMLDAWEFDGGFPNIDRIIAQVASLEWHLGLMGTEPAIRHCIHYLHIPGRATAQAVQLNKSSGTLIRVITAIHVANILHRDKNFMAMLLLPPKWHLVRILRMLGVHFILALI